MGKGIPDRWEQYTNMGRQIPGTRFFAFKVPLKDALLDNLPATVDPFGPRELMDHCPSLGLVIDLTNTNRYYDPKLFEAEKIQYEKIKTEGHVIPKTFVINRFFKVVEAFFEENASNDKLIGVHCTHGVNRTGYLICRYLIQQLGVPPDQAISDFNSARGHELERENYLENLRKAPWRHGGPSFSSARGRGYRTRPSGDSDGFNSSSEGFTSRGSDRFNSSVEGFTPPYMPHQSRRLMRRPSGPYSPNLERLSRSPIGRRISFGSSPTHGSHSFPGERLHEMARPWQSPPASRRSRGNSQNFSNSGNRNQEGTMEGEKFKSPVFGKIYYEQYYKGQVLPQYDVDFYSGWGGGFGPHRPHPRNIPVPQGSQRPRVYRGPRPYRTPPKLEEPFQEQPRHYQETPRTPYARGSRPNTFSQGTPRDVFTPENDGGRRRSNRFQPY